jgi:hypothetical protein
MARCIRMSVIYITGLCKSEDFPTKFHMHCSLAEQHCDKEEEKHLGRNLYIFPFKMFHFIW